MADITSFERSEQPVRKTRLWRALSDRHTTMSRELPGDLDPGISGADDEDRTAGELVRVPVGVAVEVGSVYGRVISEAGVLGDRERPGRRHDRASAQRSRRRLKDQGVVPLWVDGNGARIPLWLDAQARAVEVEVVGDILR